MKQLAAMTIGGMLTSARMWPDLLNRLSWALQGGAGERADWGESAFYVLVFALPGALAGAAIVPAVRWWRGRSSPS